MTGNNKIKKFKFPYKKYKPFCNYTVNDVTFTFQDPSGWSPLDETKKDPWKDKCGASSPLLWKYPVNEEI
jgi:hypothetical protein